MPYVGNKSTTFNTFSATDVSVTDDLTVTDDATIGGNLGIGNTSPSQRLDVQESTVNKGMLVYNTNTTSGASVPVFLASESDGSTTNVSIENAIDNHDFSEVIENNMCWSTAADEISGYIDWDDKVRDHIDIYDISNDVRDNLALSDHMADEIVNWVDNGCSQVDRVAVKLYDRAIKEKGDTTDGDTVVLSRDDYNRIMEVVNFIRPPVEPVAVKTSQDIANELVATVNPTEAMTLVQTAIVAKATADAQALVAAANGDSSVNDTSQE